MGKALLKPVEEKIHVVQGEYAVSASPEAVLSTVLGSCVAPCLFDKRIGVGGMNHFLLPGDATTGSDGVVYGVNAMELLINDLLKRGARKNRLEAKLFGGARMVAGLSDIGSRNASFALDFLEAEKIRCVSSSLGGENARRVRFWPVGGRAQQLLVADPDPVVITRPAPPEANDDDLELF